jgi:hypothetical protein
MPTALTQRNDYGLLIVASVLDSGVNISRIGIDEETLRYFKLSKALSISSKGRLKNYSFLDHFDDSVVDKHTTNDDTLSTVLDGCIQDSRHEPAHSLDFRISLTVCFQANEDWDRDCRRDIHLAVLVVPVPVLFRVHKNPEPNMQMLNLK